MKNIYRLIEEKSFRFALKIISLVKTLRKQKEYSFADQLLRSGTSIGANVSEAGAAQIKKTLLRKCQLHLRRLAKPDIGLD